MSLIQAQGEGYFIDPKSQIILLNGLSHIEFVARHPGIFGFQPQDLIDIYGKFNEAPFGEGKARATILSQIIKKDFIRVRRYYANNIWSINVNVFGKHNKELICRFAYTILHQGIDGIYELDKEITVNISDSMGYNNIANVVELSKTTDIGLEVIDLSLPKTN